MNTQETQTKVLALKKADNAAYMAGTKSNFVIDFVRNEFIKKAFATDETLSKEVTVTLNMTIASVVTPAIALLTKTGLYPKLLDKAEMNFTDGNIEVTFKINTTGLTEDYKKVLNDKLAITIK